MAVRLTGMISGMDTESLIKGMVDAQKLKNKRVTDKQTLLTWKQDKWKELNAKLYKLYTTDLSKMKLQSSYQTKKVTSSNENLLTVTGGTNAPPGEHTISITSLASSQYVTGGKIPDVINGSVTEVVTEKTTLAKLGLASSDPTKETVIKIKNGDKESNLVVSDTTTLGDFVNACKTAGLNANYDTTQKRLFISSKASGTDNAFTITTGTIDSTAADALASVKSLVKFSSLTSTNQTAVTSALKAIEGTSSADLTTLYDKAINNQAGSDTTEQAKIDALKTLRNFALQKADTDAKAKAVETVKSNIKSTIVNSYTSPDASIYSFITDEVNNDATITDKAQAIKERYAVYADIKSKVGNNITQAETQYKLLTSSDKVAALNNIVNKEYSSTELITVSGVQITKAANYQNQVKTEYDNILPSYKTDASDQLIAELKTYAPNSTITLTGGSLLTNLGLGNIDGSKVDSTDESEMNVVKASNSEVILDGAKLTGTTNTILANGLTLNLKGQTALNEKVSFNVSSNTQDTYDMVKKFISSYNDILKEMNNLYYAESASNYKPLSDDEKESMTDDQVEKWETKIKDSILRRDSSLGSLLTSMKNAMQTSVEVNGKKYALSSYGIQTSTDYTEKGLLHIFGNTDDAVYAGETDKLKKAIEEDPDSVMQVITGITKNLYDTMNNKMSAIPNVRSALTFYNDKVMAKEQTEYKKKISILEDKLVEMENRYYKQFAAMETAMAKLQSQTNALTGMLGQSK